MIKVIIADDHKLIRDGLKAMLEGTEEDIHIAGQAASGKELIDVLAHTEADVILMDINMPDMNGLEATQHITQHGPKIKVLMLSMLENKKYVTDALQAGALGYILKSSGQQELVHAIKTVARGEQYISTEITMKLLKNTPAAQTTSQTTFTELVSSSDLSNRELEVLHFISEGYTNAEMADMLCLSKRTVESHRQNLLLKTGCKNTASLIKYAAKHQLID